MNALRYASVVTLLSLVVGCDDNHGAKGFTLPEGDPQQGEATFVQLRCYDCHTVAGVDMPVAEEPNQVMVKLGGEVTRIKTYGELVTSIINPSHRLASGYAATLVATPEGESRMTVYNDVLTVRQLIDLVAFLQEHYELRPYEQTDYPIY